MTDKESVKKFIEKAMDNLRDNSPVIAYMNLEDALKALKKEVGGKEVKK